MIIFIEMIILHNQIIIEVGEVEKYLHFSNNNKKIEERIRGEKIDD
jgi:hypothetical protein